MVTSPKVKEYKDTYRPFVVRPVIEERVPAQAEYNAGLGALTKSKLMKMIIEKDVNVDTEFDAYVKEWYEKGGQIITNQMNEAYAKMKK